MRAEVIGLRKLGMVDGRNVQQYAVELRIGPSELERFKLGGYVTLAVGAPYVELEAMLEPEQLPDSPEVHAAQYVASPMPRVPCMARHVPNDELSVSVYCTRPRGHYGAHTSCGHKPDDRKHGDHEGCIGWPSMGMK